MMLLANAYSVFSVLFRLINELVNTMHIFFHVSLMSILINTDGMAPFSGLDFPTGGYGKRNSNAPVSRAGN